MKRKSLIAVLAAIMVMLSASVCCAADLQIVSSYPEDGQKNTSMENLGVKVVFNNKVNAKELTKSNNKAISLTDKKGKKVPVEILYSNKTGKMVLIVADTTNYKVLNNAEYKLTFGKNFSDNEGNKLGKAETITFKTYNQAMNNIVNMIIMVAMFGGIFLATAKSNSTKKEDKAIEEGDAFNPYREAKRTGKSLQEVIADHEKEVEKVNKKKAKKQKDEPVYEKHFENCAELLNNVYHVHAPAPTNKEDRSIEALNKLRRDKKAAEKAAAAAKAAKRKKKK